MQREGTPFFAGEQHLCDLMKYLHGVLVLGANVTPAGCRFSESV